MQAYRVADWMTTPPITVPSSMTLVEARELMERRRVRRLPVVDNGHLVGLITWGDVREAQPSDATTLSVYEWRELLAETPVSNVMTRSPLSIAPEAPILEAARLMLEHKISGLPVVDHGRVVGVITESDLFRLLIAEQTGAKVQDPGRTALICHHCGAALRGRSAENISSDDECWRCHHHLHRCDNCRHFDGVGCILERNERFEVIPGLHCTAFVYRTADMHLFKK